MREPPFKTEKRWFVRNGSHVDGPHPTSRILAWRREGRLPADILLSADGQRWQRVRWPATARGEVPSSGRPADESSPHERTPRG